MCKKAKTTQSSEQKKRIMQDQAPKTLAAYGLIIAVGVTGAVGDILINRWAQSRDLFSLVISYALWILSVTLLGYFLRLERYTFASAIVIAVIVHTTVAVIADIRIFGGRITNLQWIGFVFALVAFVLIELGRKVPE